MNGSEFKEALAALGWKQSDLSRKTGMHRNTVSGWAQEGPPPWVSEYLGALLGIKHLHDAFVAAPQRERLMLDESDESRAARRVSELEAMKTDD